MCGSYFGIMPFDRYHLLNISYMYTRLQGYHGIPSTSGSTGEEPDQPHPLFKTTHDPSEHSGSNQNLYNPKDYELYHLLELRGAYWLGRRVQLTAALPIRQSRSALLGQYEIRSGLGDARMGATWYPLWADSDSLSLQAGLGAEVQLPTGHFDTQNPASDALLQPGTGAWGVAPHFTTRLRYRRWGSILQAQYRMLAPNAQEVKYLNTFNGLWQVFFSINKNSLRVLPALGLAYENTSGTHYRGYWMPGTGGQVLSVIGGGSMYVGHWGIQLQLSRPLWQDLMGTQMGLGGRIQAGVSYFIAAK